MTKSTETTTPESVFDAPVITTDTKTTTATTPTKSSAIIGIAVGVVVLCVVSFFAGMQAGKNSNSSALNGPQNSNGQMTGPRGINDQGNFGGSSNGQSGNGMMQPPSMQGQNQQGQSQTNSGSSNIQTQTN